MAELVEDPKDPNDPYAIQSGIGKLSRRRKLVDALVAQALDPSSILQGTGRRVHWLEPLSKVAQALAGRVAGNRLDDQEAAFGRQLGGYRKQMIEGMMNQGRAPSEVGPAEAIEPPVGPAAPPLPTAGQGQGMGAGLPAQPPAAAGFGAGQGAGLAPGQPAAMAVENVSIKPELNANVSSPAGSNVQAALQAQIASLADPFVGDFAEKMVPATQAELWARERGAIEQGYKENDPTYGGVTIEGQFIRGTPDGGFERAYDAREQYGAPTNTTGGSEVQFGQDTNLAKIIDTANRVNVSTPAPQTQFAKDIESAVAKQYETAQSAAVTGGRILQVVTQARATLEQGTYSGPASTIQKFVAGVLDSTGLLDNETRAKLANTDLSTAQYNTILLDYMITLGARGLTNEDMQTIRSTIAQSTNSIASQWQILSAMENSAKVRIAEFEAHRKALIDANGEFMPYYRSFNPAQGLRKDIVEPLDTATGRQQVVDPLAPGYVHDPNSAITLHPDGTFTVKRRTP